ncbi:hypothetical protein C1336_000320058 [Campylobacter jejuni subsp. jejuni 1336]|nr:hypothetical protein C1336_000320058 [Campylobacter jejuni subsp. jejuni 1336]
MFSTFALALLFSIKKFKKGLKQIMELILISVNFTIKKFKKGLKTLVD